MVLYEVIYEVRCNMFSVQCVQDTVRVIIVVDIPHGRHAAHCKICPPLLVHRPEAGARCLPRDPEHNPIPM